MSTEEFGCLLMYLLESGGKFEFEIKFKLNKIRPSTLGQALRIDGVTPTAAILILSHLKRAKHKFSA